MVVLVASLKKKEDNELHRLMIHCLKENITSKMMLIRIVSFLEIAEVVSWLYF